MKTLLKEFGIFFSTLIFCYFAHKFNTWNTMIIYMLVRIWFEIILDKANESDRK